MKVIFDRSIFHGESFNKISGHPVRDAVRRGKISVFIAPDLLEETFPYWLKKEAVFFQQMQYILDISNERWFRPINEILEIEVREKARHKYYFMSCAQQKHTRKFLTGRNLPKTMERYPPNKTNYTIYPILQKLRNDVSKKLRTLENGEKSRTKKLVTFPIFEKDHQETVIQSLISRSYKDINVSTFIKKYFQKPERFPYFRTWLKGALFVPFHACNVFKQEVSKIDRNALRDVNYLVYLNHADCLVTDDLSFMTEAFNALFGETNKKIMTSNEFLDFLKSI